MWDLDRVVRLRISVLKDCERLSEAGAMSKMSGGGQLFYGHNYSRPRPSKKF